MSKSKERVGVVESDKGIADFIKETLEYAGFDAQELEYTEVFTHPEIFPKFLNKYNPRVVMIDVPMPYSDHWRFIDGLIHLPESKNRCFIACSNGADEVRKIMGDGCIPLFSKPFPEIEDIGKTVWAIFDSFKKTHTCPTFKKAS